MAPKKAAGKAAAAKKEKAVEDKTFGLKNKKGAKQQKFVEQVKKSYDATAKGGGRGPTKKEMKERQKAEEAEMLALFNIVPKKQEDKKDADAQLDPEAGPSFTDITQEIEYQRANVIAKTKITDAVFQEWRSKKLAARKAAQDEARKERLKKGILTGREIFMQASTSFVDDDNCADDADLMHEIDEDEEIRRMEELSLAAQRDARTAAGIDADEGGASTSATGGPEPGGGPALQSRNGVALPEEGRDALPFDGAGSDDSDDDVDLDELEAHIRSGA